MKQYILILACLMVDMSADAAAPQWKLRPQAQPRPLPCKGPASDRSVWPNGTLLWGNARKVVADETSTLLASVDLGSAQLGGATLKGIHLQDAANG